MADGAATISFELFMDKTYFKKGGKTHEWNKNFCRCVSDDVCRPKGDAGKNIC